nr:immunoglobulin light chain junction region [Macaca mulatta]MOY10666.1 immunoglobulin light chain junction region [Macaca mulatta]MOY11715.1 immunoglobulin light chain junction region [Macaca mulatta]MOY11799.1 immunoglobulin light chain junction region [Macaca mulatta]MOY11976.1 immunoglobulin light chain junction region [Macaca mulatta]
CYQRSSGYTF